jgi:hypothetical protein
VNYLRVEMNDLVHFPFDSKYVVLKKDVCTNSTC